MKKLSFLAIVFTFALVTLRAQAFTGNGAYVGVGVYSENSFFRETQTSTGEKGLFGAISIPIIFKYDWEMLPGLFLAPTLTYTPLGRSSAGNSATETLAHFMFPIGRNFGMSTWDWFAGPGILYRSIKGAGGTETLSNGTSTSVFARPSRSVSMMNITLNAGGSYTTGNSRFATDIVSEGLFSEKRSFSLMFSYCYLFSGGLR